MIRGTIPAKMLTECRISCTGKEKPVPNLDGPAIRNANRGDSGECFARIDSQKKNYFHNVRAIGANHLKPAIRNLKPPEERLAKKRGSAREP